MKLLATTCNFGDLKDSLVRDRIICGIQDKQLREDLLKDPCLDLQRCLDTCRAAELSKERSKTLEESEHVNSLRDQIKRGKAFGNKRCEKVDKRREKFERREKSENDRRENERTEYDAYRKETKKCKYCGGIHRPGKQNCPAFGKRCSYCGIMNHFASQCMAKANVNVVETEGESDEEYCLTLDSIDESEMISVHATSDHEYSKKLFATINLGNSPVKFQLDSGATCNLEDWNELTPTRKWLTMYNNTIMKPLGTCAMEVLNPKNSVLSCGVCSRRQRQSLTNPGKPNHAADGPG